MAEEAATALIGTEYTKEALDNRARAFDGTPLGELFTLFAEQI